MNIDFWDSLKDDFLHFITVAGIRLVYAAVAIILGLFLIRMIKAFVRRLGDRSHADPSLFSFVYSLIKVILFALLTFVVGVILGIQASAFLTLVGAIGIAVGLALQGSLSNFAGGILILLFKPFKIGDEITIDNLTGIVERIDILYTRIRTFDGKMITIPNGKVSNSSVENGSTFAERRVDIILNIPFAQDVDQLRQIITLALAQHPKVLSDRPVQLWVSAFSESSMKMSARCWCNSEDYWQVYWDQIEVVQETLYRYNIQLAVPKRELYDPKANLEK